MNHIKDEGRPTMESPELLCKFPSRSRRHIAAPFSIIAVAVIVLPASAQTPYLHRLFKVTTYQQTSDAVPTEPTGAYAGADIFSIDSPNPGPPAAADVQWANSSSSQTLLLYPSSSGIYTNSLSYQSQVEMDEALPADSVYTFHFVPGSPPNPGDPPVPTSASIITPPYDLYPAEIPYFSAGDYTALQQVDPAQPFQLHWEGFASPSGASYSYWFLSITRTSDFQTIYNSAGPNTSPPPELEANVLESDTSYFATLWYSSRRQAPSVWGASEVLFDRKTDLAFTTLASPLGNAGDYNPDGSIDAADYIVWRKSLGQNITLPNETATPGQVTNEDFEVWRSNFGVPASGASTNFTSIPEPLPFNQLLAAALICATIGRPRNRK